MTHSLRIGLLGAISHDIPPGGMDREAVRDVVNSAGISKRMKLRIISRPFPKATARTLGKIQTHKTVDPLLPLLLPHGAPSGTFIDNKGAQ